VAEPTRPQSNAPVGIAHNQTRQFAHTGAVGTVSTGRTGLGVRDADYRCSGVDDLAVGSLPLLTGEQDANLKSILPPLAAGYWWEAPADAKGFKIKLRWRDAARKQQCYVFRRLGKHELQTLRKGNHAEQRNDLADRLTGELINAGRSDLAARVKTNTQNDS